MSEESVLTTILEEILQAHQSSLDDLSYESATAQLEECRSSERPRNSRVMKVLRYEKLVLVLALELFPLGPHFHGRREFSVCWLVKSIDTVMGLYLRFIVSQAEIMKKLASDDDFPDYKTVKTTLDLSYDDSLEGLAARKKIDQWKKQITNSQGASNLATFNDIFHEIDAHAEEAFARVHYVGEKTDAYMCALGEYCDNVVASLRTKWLKGSNGPTESDDNIRQYDRITARIAVWLSPQDDASDAPTPLLSGWLLDYAWSSLNAMKEGIIEVYRWFEPLLDYYPSLHTHSHDMDDFSEVMIYNVMNSRRIAPDADAQLCRFLWENRNTLIFRLHNTMTNVSERETQRDRPRDRTQINDAFDKLPTYEKRAFRQLVELMKKDSKRDLRHSRVMGAFALHVTKWNWKCRKNSKRDVEPCVKAILLELRKAVTYRTAILADSFNASLRKQLEDLLVQMTEPIYYSLLHDGTKSQVWQWWDDIEIPKGIVPVTSANVEENFKSKLRRIQLRNNLEQRDQNAIDELVAYIEHMPCAKATIAEDSALCSEVAEALDTLVNALKLNGARLRHCIMGDDPDDVKAAVDIKIPKIEDLVDEKNTPMPQIAGPSSKRPRESTGSCFVPSSMFRFTATSILVSGSPAAMNKRVRRITLQVDPHFDISDDDLPGI
ncbi:uncharacterized protein EDB91DRAFT_1153268 [Suillus paluster]|uniref:uncharacterized protein n=1 Tax=Suillus paluster TaxID=48578 RepID=UPI001B874607|nr:uncharacterized protein EDB91DRAFT_1153268 [Suillus paluster]KAG1731831.1 hypothetical protein EDB91DRAFT_1153268 [Suillus paluster]